MVFGSGSMSFLEMFKKRKWNSYLIIGLLAFFFSITAYQRTEQIISTANYDFEKQDYYISKYLEEKLDSPKSMEDYHVMVHLYSAHVRFNIEQYETKNVVVHLSKVSHLKTGDKVLFSNQTILNNIEKIFEFSQLKKESDVWLGVVGDKKDVANITLDSN
jgi:hypothetical protein